ncbi:MAG TPA: FHA domain-containing protein [Gemmatimonadaceae bacterium]|nr:FHA domain-containing protein [Gemmatimonadaceae bacterium]
MPVIQVNDKQHTLKLGQTRVGAGPGVDVSVSDDAALGVQAVLELLANNQVVIRRARDNATVRVNGVPLVEPTPLIHGDKVEVGGREVLFSEDKKVGATQFVSASDIASIAAKRSGPARATATTGGRLVSLVDGKEYQIPASGVTFGREAGSDVVVAQPEVSRKHASIAPAENGYVITDHSTNGIWVNGVRVQSSQLLARADVVRVGSEEFRFYADVAPAKPTPVASPVQSSPPPSPRPPATQAAAEPASAPRPASAPAVAAARSEPPKAPPKPSPAAAEPTAPVPTMPARSSSASAARPQPARPQPRKEPASAARAAKEEPRSGIPSWVWFAIIILVAVAGYFLGQGRG